MQRRFSKTDVVCVVVCVVSACVYDGKLIPFGPFLGMRAFTLNFDRPSLMFEDLPFYPTMVKGTQFPKTHLQPTQKPKSKFTLF